MGMYTRLVLNVAIKDNASILPTLKAMCTNGGEDQVSDPRVTDRMPWMFWSSSDYHDNIQHCSLVHDEIGKEYKLSVTCDLKNYDNEIKRLADWLAPHVTTEELAGYSRYEEDEGGCELLRFRGGKAVWQRAQLQEVK